MPAGLMLDKLMTGTSNHPCAHWSPRPESVEPSLKRGVFYGLLLSLPLWGLLLKILF
jgi:hypothetical protein